MFFVLWLVLVALSVASSPLAPWQDNVIHTNGVATYYYQKGNPGACGNYNSDSAMICAMDQTLFGTNGPSSPLCNLQVQITNLKNNKVVNVTIADDCPSCGDNSIDLSVGAFQALEPDLGVGEFNIIWKYVS